MYIVYTRTLHKWEQLWSTLSTFFLMSTGRFIFIFDSVWKQQSSVHNFFFISVLFIFLKKKKEKYNEN